MERLNPILGGILYSRYIIYEHIYFELFKIYRNYALEICIVNILIIL